MNAQTFTVEELEVTFAWLKAAIMKATGGKAIVIFQQIGPSFGLLVIHGSKTSVMNLGGSLTMPNPKLHGMSCRTTWNLNDDDQAVKDRVLARILADLGVAAGAAEAVGLPAVVAPFRGPVN